MRATYYGQDIYGVSLMHYGRKGMKWGYEDGQRVAGKRTAEEEMLDNIKNKNYTALQKQVQDLQTAGNSPEEVQKMLNGNIAENEINEAWKKKDYGAIQEQVNKLAQSGYKPEEIEEMLWKVQGLDYSKKGTDEDPRKNMSTAKSAGSKSSSTTKKKKKSKKSSGENEVTTTLKANGDREIKVGKNNYTVEKGKSFTEKQKKELEDYVYNAKKIDIDKVKKITGASTVHGGASNLKHSGMFKGCALRSK